MGKKITVSIYSGKIPAPIFIENLIRSLSKQNVEIFLFGRLTEPVTYCSSNIKIFSTPQNRFRSLGFIFFQMIILFFTNNKRFFKIISYYREISKKQKINFISWWGKVLPIINHLPDVFHIQWAKSVPRWFFLKELFNVKIVLSLRGAHVNYSPLADEELQNAYRKIFPKIDRFHAVSVAIAKESEKYGAISDKIDIIYSAINPNAIKSNRKLSWNQKSNYHFISVGRYHWKKGYHYAISAIYRLIKNNMDIHYTIIAKERPSEEILYQVKDLSLQNNITFLKNLSQEKIYKKMANSDCLLLPSVEEGIANVVLESMAIGLPVISSNCGGMEEIIEDNLNGFLFQTRDVKNLTDVMKKVVNKNPKKMEEIIQRGMLRIDKKHNFFRLGFEMKKLYESIDRL